MSAVTSFICEPAFNLSDAYRAGGTAKLRCRRWFRRDDPIAAHTGKRVDAVPRSTRCSRAPPSNGKELDRTITSGAVGEESQYERLGDPAPAWILDAILLAREGSAEGTSCRAWPLGTLDSDSACSAL
jgi:hypothetical protein